MVGALNSHSTNYVIFNFSGGDYDGRRYLMNYKYNASTQAYNLVCVDMDISIDSETRETKLEYVSKFTLENIKLGQTNLDGTWYEATTDTAQAVDSDTFIIGDTTYNIPSDVSDLNNDAGYLTSTGHTLIITNNTEDTYTLYFADGTTGSNTSSGTYYNVVGVQFDVTLVGEIVRGFIFSNNAICSVLNNNTFSAGNGAILLTEGAITINTSGD